MGCRPSSTKIANTYCRMATLQEVLGVREPCMLQWKEERVLSEGDERLMCGIQPNRVVVGLLTTFGTTERVVVKTISCGAAYVYDRIHRQCKGAVGIVQLHARWKRIRGANFLPLVMAAYHGSLKDCHELLSWRQVASIGVDVIRGLRVLYQIVGCLHVDMCPDNVCVEIQDRTTDHVRGRIIDFDLSRPLPSNLANTYCSEPCRWRFASVAMHERRTRPRCLSVHDELEMVLYTLAWCLHGTLPWDKLAPERPPRPPLDSDPDEVHIWYDPLLATFEANVVAEKIAFVDHLEQSGLTNPLCGTIAHLLRLLWTLRTIGSPLELLPGQVPTGIAKADVLAWEPLAQYFIAKLSACAATHTTL